MASRVQWDKLVGCKNFSAVEDFFRQRENCSVEERSELKSLCVLIGLHCPGYDRCSGSVQRSILSGMGQQLQTSFLRQEEARLMEGFDMAMCRVSGAEWRNAPTEIPKKLLAYQAANIPGAILSDSSDEIPKALLN